MKITINGEKRVVAEYPEPRLVSNILKDNGFKVSMPCGGAHKCGKCRVKISGSVSEMNENEKRLLSDADGYRLACFARAEGDCEITLSESKGAVIMSDGFCADFLSEPFGEKYGFAVDIGTTTVAVYMYDLKTCLKIGQDAFLNPQQSFGGNVISRIEAALLGHADELSRLIADAIEESFKKLCAANGVSVKDADSAVITGNTTMLYLLLSEDLKCLSGAPFEISRYLGEYIAAEKCGFCGFENMTVYFPKTMSAFVGSDITCSLLASYELMKDGSAALMIDIGTNGETALMSGGKLWCCSTAAGPAFEGAGITMGSMAVNGAVNKVWLENGELSYTVIGSEKAESICGSGLIDAVSALLKAGIVDKTGRIDNCSEKYSRYLIECDEAPAIKIGDSGVIITQKDIRSVQLAKAAVCAGIYSLLSVCQITPDSVERLILAGGFGSFINPENAAAIGLIPKELAGKTVVAGNAAGAGASAMLLSKAKIQLGERLAQKSETLDLSTSPLFNEKYIECMSFE